MSEDGWNLLTEAVADQAREDRNHGQSKGRSSTDGAIGATIGVVTLASEVTGAAAQKLYEPVVFIDFIT